MDELDILNRTPVVEQIMTVLNGLRDNGQSMSFSLNGKWGSGKTFVLNMLEKRIMEANTNSNPNEKPFCYIRYDCWKYDYYPEPLVAFISAVQDAVIEDTIVGNAAYVKNELKSTVSELGKWGMELAGALIRTQCGVDPSKILLKIINHDSERILKSYDTNLTVTKALNGLKETIKKISSENTLVIVVDELDRCLPEYMIRVLERLHHLFEGLDNVIMIVATDKAQLEHTIRHIYGAPTDASAYLQKMIHFELSLDLGEVNDEEVLREKFSSFFNLFDENNIPQKLNIREFYDVLFKGIPIREKKHWTDKICLIHRLSFGEKRPGSEILFYELFWTVLTKIYNIIPSTDKIQINVRDAFSMFYKKSDPAANNKWRELPFIVYLTEKFKRIHTDINPNSWDDYPRNITIYHTSDLSMLFWYWSKTVPQNSQPYCLPQTTDPMQYDTVRKDALDNCERIKRFQGYMHIIN